MMKSRLDTPSSQSTWMTTCPLQPAPGTAIVFCTTSSPLGRNSAVDWTVVLKVAFCARISLLGVVDPGGVPVV